MIALFFIGFALDLSQTEAEELARKIKAGDHLAFRQFFEAHHKRLYHYLISRKIREEVAEDIVQQAFIWIWEHRSEIDSTKSIRSYLFRIGYTRLLNHVRDSKKLVDSSSLEMEHSSQEMTDAEIMNTELKKAIEKAISAMPEKRKAVFELCYLQELSYKEAAEVLELSPKTIENHMGLALKQLRDSLSFLRP